MKNPNTTSTTRASLIATASHNTRWFARLMAGSAVLSSSALATVWDGDVSTDWNDNNNWAGNAGNSLDATININPITNPPYIATISANSTQTVRDLFVGIGGSTNGRLDHTAGTAATGGGNWMEVGINGGTGTYNLADTTSAGGPLTGFGTGTGSMTVGGRLYVGGSEARNGGGSTGTVNVNTSGTLAINGDLSVGIRNCVGTMRVDAGTITTNGWNFIGRELGLAGGNGSFSMGGGTLTNNNGNARTYVGLGNATGSFAISGGTYNNIGTTNDNQFAIGVNNLANGTTPTFSMTGGTINARRLFTIGGTEGFGGNGGETGPGKGSATINGAGALLNVTGEFWVGQGAGSVGDLTLSAGTIQTSSWVAIGRGTGTGTVNMTGGTWNKTGDGQFIVGAGGPGTMTMSGGLVDVQSGFTWIGETGAATTATLTISGSAEFRTPTMSVGQSAPNAILNLDGGTLRTARFIGSREQNDTGANGGTGTVNFNGTQIVATAENTVNFISNTVDNAVIGDFGLLVDSNGFNLSVPKSLSGTGGVVKSGAGTLSLLGNNSYAGDNVLDAGGLNLRANATGTGSITMADDTTLGLTAPFAGAQLTAASATFGTSGDTTLNLNLGDVAGSNPFNSILDVTGALAVNGVVTVNVSGAKFAVGEIPLISYNAAQLSGSGSFLLAALPAGVVATLETDPDYFGTGLGAVYLDITGVALPEWDGTNEVVLELSGDTVEASADVTVLNATGIVVGQTVRGAGIPLGTTVTAINGLVITLSQAATITDTFVDLDFVATAGTNEGLWDTTTENWVDQVTSLSSVYTDPNPVLFSDLATGPTSVVLNSVVTPSEVNFNNSTLAYSLSGSGAIDGTTGLVKQGTQSLTISGISNTYTGVTRLQGGTTSVDVLTDGGVAGPLGAASGDPANLVLAGGILDYTGAALTVDRGFTVGGAGSAIRNASDLTVSGQVLSTGVGSGFVKQGAGNLIFTHGGANTFGSAVFAGFNVQAGSVTFDGTAGGQVNSVAGEFHMGTALDVPANLNVTNTTLNVASWLAIGLGNGNDGVSSLTVTNSTLNTGNFSTGYNNGQANNASEAFVNVTGSTWTNNGTVNYVESADATGTLNLNNSTWISNVGVFNMAIGNNTNATLTISGNSELRVNRFLMAHGTGSVANVIIEDSGSLNKTTGSWMSIGNSGTGVGNMTVRDSGSVSSVGGDFNISDTATSKGFLTIEDSATVSSGGNTFVGKGTGTEGGVTQTGGTFNQDGGYLVIARFDDSIGNYNISGGVLNQDDVNLGILVAEEGDGTLTVSGTAEVNVNGAGLFITTQISGLGNGVVNLNGGTITCRRIAERDNALGNSTFNFNGGILKAGAGSNADFMSGLDSAVVGTGGAIIDSNGETIAIGQQLTGTGALTKQGAGTLLLNGSNTYPGATTVTAGTLAGSGSVAGPLVVSAGAVIAPGNAIGTFGAAGATVSGSFACQIDGAGNDQLAVSGALDLSSATDSLDIAVSGAGATLPVYVIASYTSLTGTFNTVNGLPSGYSVDYAYNGGTQIALVQALTPFQTWVNSYFPGETNPAIIGAAADPDGDGQANNLEFALGGAPDDGGDNAKVYHLTEDSNDAGTGKELLMTIAVRNGGDGAGLNPVFTPATGGNPVASQDGVTYTIQGGTDLTFTGTVSAVAPVTTGLPAAPAGYEYRTFSLEGSDGLPSKGFLRVNVTP